GQRLVAAVVAAGLPVTPLPGASAPLAAIMAAGHAGNGICFIGFPPTKTSARKTWFEGHASTSVPLALFESPKRLVASLKAMVEVFGADRPAVVARELTKMHETFHRGTLGELADTMAAMDRIRGEIVVVIEPPQADDLTKLDPDSLLLEALQSMRTKDAANHVAALTGLPKQSLYTRALHLKTEQASTAGPS
ncbi:MAG: SAM-dependent methyltransferase, partial [Pseudomonadota bacterium]